MATATATTSLRRSEMNDIAIKIEGLGKRYRYGAAQSVSSNLRADLTDWVCGVFRLRKDLKPETVDQKAETGSSGTQVSGFSPQVSSRSPQVSSLPQTTAASRPTRLQSASESSGFSLSTTGIIGRNRGLQRAEIARSAPVLLETQIRSKIPQ